MLDRAEEGYGIVARPFERTTTTGRRPDGLCGDVEDGSAEGGGDGAAAGDGGDSSSMCRKEQRRANSLR